MSHQKTTIDNEWDEDDDFYVTEYETTSSPNDFNLKTLADFVERGNFIIPQFQRHYVWSKKEASKLVESLLIGLPIPQIFLFEEKNNSFLVIDGQQRLLSIFFFVKGRFPKESARAKFRQALASNSGSDWTKLLLNDDLFEDFSLSLSMREAGKKHPFSGLTFESLADRKLTFELRTVRCVIIRQSKPNDDSSSVFEIFHRLNTGGKKLNNQEIRSCLYHSPFFDLLYKLNQDARWRKLFGTPHEEKQQRDIQSLLRAIAFLCDGPASYQSSMVKFLNTFSKKAMQFDSEMIHKIAQAFDSFLSNNSGLSADDFETKTAKNFSVAIFEVAFFYSCRGLFAGKVNNAVAIVQEELESFKSNAQFLAATKSQTTSSQNVRIRFEVGGEIFGKLG